MTCEILAEEMMQAAIFSGQDSQGRIITHRADRLLASAGHRSKDQFHIFHRPARHQLAAAASRQRLILLVRARFPARHSSILTALSSCSSPAGQTVSFSSPSFMMRPSFKSPRSSRQSPDARIPVRASHMHHTGSSRQSANHPLYGYSASGADRFGPYRR